METYRPFWRGWFIIGREMIANKSKHKYEILAESSNVEEMQCKNLKKTGLTSY